MEYSVILPQCSPLSTRNFSFCEIFPLVFPHCCGILETVIFTERGTSRAKALPQRPYRPVPPPGLLCRGRLLRLLRCSYPQRRHGQRPDGEPDRAAAGRPAGRPTRRAPAPGRAGAVRAGHYADGAAAPLVGLGYALCIACYHRRSRRGRSLPAGNAERCGGSISHLLCHEHPVEQLRRRPRLLQLHHLLHQQHQADLSGPGQLPV